MKRHALALVFLLGVWCGATVFMWQVAIRSFTVANALAASDDPGFRAVVEGLPAENLRAAVRYQASEVNRLFFNGWGWTQILLAAPAVFSAWRLRNRLALAAVGVMAALTLFLQLYVVPETIRLGRAIDFAREGEMVAASEMFWTLHHTYTGLDMTKFVLGIAAAAIVLARKS